MDTMDPNKDAELVRQDIIKNHLKFVALIQDIIQCTGPLELLNELNVEGREQMTALRSKIDELAYLADSKINENERNQLLAQAESYRKQFTASLAKFRKANVISACAIDKLARENLLSMSEEQQNALRRRRDKQGLASASSQVTDKLFNIAIQLAETTQKSADTLDTLLTSSDKVSSTKNELEHQQQVIVQSGKLLGKYGRREVTDKVLLVLAFIFFLACVFYILQKRLF